MRQQRNRKNSSIQELLFASVGLIVLFITIMIFVQVQDVPWIDTWIQQFVVAPEDTLRYSFFERITKLGSATFAITFVILILLFMFWKDRDKKGMFLFASGVIVSTILNGALKSIIQRPRPQINEAVDAVGYSFPSGHAMASMIIYGLAAYYIVTKIHNRLGKMIVICVMATLIALIGISRVVLLAHYPTDIVGGYCLSGALVCIFISLDRLWKRKGR